MTLSACAADTAPPPAVRYPQLLQQAGIEGPVRFRVRLDAAGNAQPSTMETLASPNPGFAGAVRNALTEWRDPANAGRVVEHTVRFVLMDTAATDSVARCRSSANEWVVCARRVQPTIIRDPTPERRVVPRAAQRDSRN